jgi:hypothetical protein
MQQANTIEFRFHRHQFAATVFLYKKGLKLGYENKQLKKIISTVLIPEKNPHHLEGQGRYGTDGKLLRSYIGRNEEEIGRRFGISSVYLQYKFSISSV